MAAVRVQVKRVAYPVVGATWAGLEHAMALLGPVRGGVTYPAYTDWDIRWCYSARALGATQWVARAVEVDAEVTITLPSWHVPRRADGALVARWAAYLEALRAHEDGHAALARRAAHAVRAAMVSAGMRSHCSTESLAEAERNAVTSALNAARLRDVAYDRDVLRRRRRGPCR
jgi:predicted secreted Zn-dependent protease